MGERAWRWGRRLACAAYAVVLLGLGCVADAPPRPGLPQLQQLLDRQAQALAADDRAAYLDTFVAHAPAQRAAQRREFRTLSRLPLAAWRLRLHEVRPDGAGGYTARAVRQQRLRGWDDRTGRTAARVEFRRVGGRWGVARVAEPGLWGQGAVRQVYGERSLVLGVGRQRAELREVARAADRAVREVERYRRDGWPRRLVLEVPRNLEGVGRLLGAAPETYRGIAAVTTGQRRSAEAPSDRIVVNPDAYTELSGAGRQFVLTHEAVHVATRELTGAATPMWLSEGLGDWVANRAAGLSAAQAAPELQAAVRAGRSPQRLPTDADFAFDAEPDVLARAYEGAWLACRALAERHGVDGLLAFYETAGRDGVRTAMERELGMSMGEFTRQWHVYVARELG